MIHAILLWQRILIYHKLALKVGEMTRNISRLSCQAGKLAWERASMKLKLSDAAIKVQNQALALANRLANQLYTRLTLTHVSRNTFFIWHLPDWTRCWAESLTTQRSKIFGSLAECETGPPHFEAGKVAFEASRLKNTWWINPNSSRQ